ncbi:MAG: serine hydrolase domain-containing protein [Pseudomonadota bacterium]
MASSLLSIRLGFQDAGVGTNHRDAIAQWRLWHWRRSVCMGALVIVCLSLLGNACADSHKIRGEEANPALEALLNELDAIRTASGVASAGIALVTRDKIVYAGGLGNIRWGSPEAVTENTLFRVGSITKSFVGLTAIALSRSERHLFDEPIARTLPALLRPSAQAQSVRLAELLEHTAGLSDLSREEFAFQGEHVTFAQAIDIDPSTRQLSWPASRHSSYSNAGYGMAGYVLEARFGQPFEQLVHDVLLDPLEMRNAGFFVTPQSPVLAAGYDTDGKTPIPYWHMIYRSFGGLNATSRDMGLFVNALLQPISNNGLFRSTSERTRFENPSTTLASRTGLEYGYGLGSYHWFRDGHRFHGHGGDADGYLSHYGYSNEAGVGYFVVITAFNKKPLNAMRESIEQFLLETYADAPNETRPTPTLESGHLSSLTGEFAAVTRRFGQVNTQEPVLTIAMRNGRLETQYNGRRLALLPVNERHFRRPWQPDATYAFIEDGSDLYFQGDIGNFKRLRRTR